MNRIRIAIQLKSSDGAAEKKAWAPADSTSVYRVVELAYMPNADLTANGTNYCTLRPYVGSTAIAAARPTSSTGFTALTAEAITLTGTLSQLEVSRANPLNITTAKTASGVAVDVALLATLEEVRQ